MHKARYQKISDVPQAVQCCLCPHNCFIKEGHTGRCRVRKNFKGILYSLVYAKHTSVGLDPIEKKPLYHFHPGTKILSVGTLGCNLSCGFCQNWEISQSSYREELIREIQPKEMLQLVRNYDSTGIAYTYNEPLINYEWVYDTAQIMAEHGFKNVLVTNGYIHEEPLGNLIPYIDAVNIDVKSFQDEFYVKICKGKIGPVLRSVEFLFKKNKHLEITFLVIPGENDHPAIFKDFVDWISALNPSIPLHLSRYYPQYTFTRDPTSLAVLEKLRDIAVRKLSYVYIGNAREKNDAHTYCMNRCCNALLVERFGYTARVKGLKGNTCSVCKTENNFIV
ncbi:MAG: AmmeMemoRadiSam system radical SAM enzyme [bacterium]